MTALITSLNPGSFGFGSAFGLGDITYQGFITSKKSGAVSWGLGGSLAMPTHTDDRFGTNKWSAGPAAVMFATPGNWVIGLIVENIWSFAGDSDAGDVNVFSGQVAANLDEGPAMADPATNDIRQKLVSTHISLFIFMFSPF